MRFAFRSVFTRLPPLFLTLFVLLAGGAYFAIERYVAVSANETRSEDLYWTVAQMQIELERFRAELIRLKNGEADIEQTRTRLALAQSRFSDFITPSKLHGLLSDVEGFNDIRSQLQLFFQSAPVLRLRPSDAPAVIARIDALRPSLAEFAVQSRVAEVASRDARNQALEHNKKLVSFLWFALWCGICVVLMLLLYRYHGARRDVASRQALLEKERAAHKATVAAELDRTTFLATISHEIRSPLQTMQVCLELMEPDIPSGSRTHTALERMKTSMSHLMTQVRDIMDLSAMHTMQLRLHPEEVKLEQILREAVDAYRPQLESKGLWLETMWPNLPASIRMDGSRLRQIVGNLVSNAIRYTDHGEVSVLAKVFQQEGLNTLEVRVRDTGIGIPLEYQSRIFQPFFQGTARKAGSSGLGLAIVKELVGLLGGEIELHSEVGAGSEFIVRLPIQLYPRAISHQPCILLVDDDPNIREPFSDCLKMDGYEVVTATNVKEACRQLQERSFSVVLLDMQLGNESGYQVAEFLRKSRNRHASIIAMTAYPEEYSDHRAHWFAERLEKPFDLNRLRQTLRKQPA
ncbi:hybrid sensor histidine kinase/response regulator [Chromobacterium sp. IIBBL 290-4]|uniref:ATP-binding response regulator n=1 Tax=Chromobacterium sp. IIBBL 290-4 TaxID=2953890 RepID=UPI0020B641F8|nr:hybrid sensor histidine kinase/response regulator [Chromobacterium sp. IIBBL 290-4]UTH75825.1 hybrid sensor histidine kinase/response regulator [Chromobacterium sp. IIBBL 290-4]